MGHQPPLPHKNLLHALSLVRVVVSYIHGKLTPDSSYGQAVHLVSATQPVYVPAGVVAYFCTLRLPRESSYKDNVETPIL